MGQYKLITLDYELYIFICILCNKILKHLLTTHSNDKTNAFGVAKIRMQMDKASLKLRVPPTMEREDGLNHVVATRCQSNDHLI